MAKRPKASIHNKQSGSGRNKQDISCSIKVRQGPKGKADVVNTRGNPRKSKDVQRCLKAYNANK